MASQLSILSQVRGGAPRWFVFWVTFLLGNVLLQLSILGIVYWMGPASIVHVGWLAGILTVVISYIAFSSFCLWRCRHNAGEEELPLLASIFFRNGILVGSLLIFFLAVLAFNALSRAGV